MEMTRRLTVLMSLFFAFSAFALPAQVQNAELEKNTASRKRADLGSKRTRAKSKESPQTIRVGNADLPFTEIVPSTEAVLVRLQEILGGAKSSTLKQLPQSIDELTSRIQNSREETTYLVGNVRSTQQLAEARLLWQRERRDLENVNGVLQAQAGLLAGYQQQLLDIQQTWSLAAQSEQEVALPEGLPERIQQVQETALRTDAALRRALELLIQLQVHISEDRKAIDEALQEIKSAEGALHKGVFAQDSAPLWAALCRGSYASLKKQARANFIIVRSRTLTFCQSYRERLLAFFLLLIGMTSGFTRLRSRLRRQAEEQKSAMPPSWNGHSPSQFS